MKMKDMAGLRFGKLIVLNFDCLDKRGQAKWLCKCDCGNLVSVNGNTLRTRQISCGCIVGGRVQLEPGQRFSRLTVIGFDRVDKNRQARWWVKCDCGKTISTLSNSLIRNLTKSCGCLKFESKGGTPPLIVKHGEAARGKMTKEYRAWRNMINRCTIKTAPYYPDYGGRGITYCERWRDFENFLADMGRSPLPDLSIDRIDNDGNYEPGNCRWATRHEQNLNRHRKT